MITYLSAYIPLFILYIGDNEKKNKSQRIPLGLIKLFIFIYLNIIISIFDINIKSKDKSKN